MGPTIYVSATPGPYEMERAQQVVEQIIRPTGLIDPEIIVRPAKGQVDDLLDEIRRVTAQDQRVLVTTLTNVILTPFGLKIFIGVGNIQKTIRILLGVTDFGNNKLSVVFCCLDRIPQGLIEVLCIHNSL